MIKDYNRVIFREFLNTYKKGLTYQADKKRFNLIFIKYVLKWAEEDLSFLKSEFDLITLTFWDGAKETAEENFKLLDRNNKPMECLK
jgi:hypothetical protein